MSFTITLKKKNPNNKDLLICCPALVSWQLALFSQGVEEKLLKREPGASLGLPSGEDPVFSSRGAWVQSLVGRNWVERYLRSHRSKVSKVRCKERKPDQSTNERKLASR